MSLVLSSTPSIHPFGEIAGRLAASGGQPLRARGPDRGVRRHCVDENAPAAQPWDRNRFGSARERIATVESLVVIAKELQAEGARRFPRGRVLELEQQHAHLTAALAQLMAAPPAERPIGAPAAIRIELDAVDVQLAEHKRCITRTDVDVYEAIFHFLCYAGSGRWYPSWEKIAAAARCCVRSVGRALKRLDHHGLLSWISRSRVQAPATGDTKRTRGQTSHAYFLDLRKRMADRVYQRFLQLREKRFKRLLGRSPATPPATPSPVPAPPIDRHAADLRQSVASLGAALSLREGHGG